MATAHLLEEPLFGDLARADALGAGPDELRFPLRTLREFAGHQPLLWGQRLAAVGAGRRARGAAAHLAPRPDLEARGGGQARAAVHPDRLQLARGPAESKEKQ